MARRGYPTDLTDTQWAPGSSPCRAAEGWPPGRSDSGDHGRPVGEDDRKGGVRGFDGHKCVKGRKRQILVDTQGFPVSCRVEPAGMADRRAARG
jgi:putative transposase